MEQNGLRCCVTNQRILRKLALKAAPGTMREAEEEQQAQSEAKSRPHALAIILAVQLRCKLIEEAHPCMVMY